MRTSAFALCALPLLAALGVVAMTAEPSAQRRRTDNAALGMPVSTGAIIDDPGTYVGKPVTVSAGVQEMLSPTTFLVDQHRATGVTAVAPVGKPMMVVAPYLSGPLELSKYLMMSGQLIRFQPDMLARLVPDYRLDLTPDLIAKYTGQPVLVATSVIDSAFKEVGRKPLAPPTADEQAMSTAMKSVSSASAALRSAAQESRADAVVEQARALQPLFTRVETAWDDLGQVAAAQWARDAREASAAIERSAQAGDWTTANASVAALNQTCQNCHGAYRDRADDGTFRFRAGSF